MSAPVEVAGTAVVLAEEPVSVSLGVVRGDNPAELTAAATQAANVLADVIESRKLYSIISGRRYVRCEGWTTLATMMGVLPREVGVTALDDGGYEATVELVRISDGTVLTRASALCGMDETTWKNRNAYARRSMATTRATGKACRIAFSWVMALAGFEVTPAEEIPHDEGRDERPAGWRLPGDEKKWDGHGGKLLSDVPVSVLEKVSTWLAKKDDPRNAALIAAIDAEVAGRDA